MKNIKDMHQLWQAVILKPLKLGECVLPQCADGESNKIVLEKKTTVTVWMFNTYRVRNHFVSNPTNSKSIRLKKVQKIIFLLQ